MLLHTGACGAIEATLGPEGVRIETQRKTAKTYPPHPLSTFQGWKGGFAGPAEP